MPWSLCTRVWMCFSRCWWRTNSLAYAWCYRHNGQLPYEAHKALRPIWCYRGEGGGWWDGAHIYKWVLFILGLICSGCLCLWEMLGWFHREESRLDIVLAKEEEIENLALIEKIWGGKKGGSKSDHKRKNDDSYSLYQGKKVLSQVKCFKCHNMGHYALLCPKRKKSKQ